MLIGSTGTTPITNVTLKNSIVINGANTASAVVVSDGASPGTAGYFNNITIQNNNIQRAFIGLYTIAVQVPGNGSGMLVTGNDLNTAGANSIRLAALYCQGVDGATYSNNNIGNMANTADASNITGIWFATGVSNATISGNNISAISGSLSAPRGIVISTGTTGANNITVTGNTLTNLSCTSSTGVAIGINLFAATGGVRIHKNYISNIKNITSSASLGCNAITLASTLTVATADVYNNMIYDVAGYGSATVTNNGFGIAVAAGGGYNIWYNSISLSTNQTVATGTTAAISISSSITTAGSLNVRNNIFANTQTTGTRYAIYSGAANTVYSAINNNDYYSLGSVGFLGVAQPLLTNWQTATGQDGASIAANPNFLSATDLHISINMASVIDGAATPIAGITTDIDMDTRNLANPDIGADEFAIVPCTIAAGGTAIGSISFCTSGTPTITASSYSTGVGSDYQWMYSASAGNYPGSGTAVSGQTNPNTLTTGVVSSTSYYWLRVTCSAGAPAYSNMITVTVNAAPTISINEAGPINLCNPPTTSQLLTTTTSASSPSYVWKKDGVTIAGEINPTYTVTASGSYTVMVTNGITNCSATSAATVVNITVTGAPTIFPVSPISICLGGSQALTASPNSTPTPSTILSQNFESGIGTWTVVNTSTGGASPALVAWAIQPTGYTYLSEVFTGNGGTQFIMANSDAAGSGVTAFTTITSPSFSTVGYTSLSLDYIHYYRHISAAGAFTEVSTDGGTVWAPVQTYSVTTGTAASFASANLNLNAYINLPDVRIRFRHSGGWYYYWAVDNILVTGSSYNYSWTASPALNAGLPAGAGRTPRSACG